MTGSAAVTDVSLTGTVTLTTGPNTESGTAHFIATANGRASGTLTMPSGIRTNLRDYSTNVHTGMMTLPGQTPVPEPAEDLTGPHPAWFYPAFIINSAMVSTYLQAFVGQEIRDGQSVQHIAIWPAGRGATRLRSEQILSQRIPSALGATMRAGQYDLYLDSDSLLPVALTLNLRAMNPPVNGVSTPATFPGLHDPLYFQEEYRFSDYRRVQGRLIAFHITEATANGLAMDIQVSTVKFNSGAIIAGN